MQTRRASAAAAAAVIAVALLGLAVPTLGDSTYYGVEVSVKRGYNVVPGGNLYVKYFTLQGVANYDTASYRNIAYNTSDPNWNSGSIFGVSTQNFLGYATSLADITNVTFEFWDAASNSLLYSFDVTSAVVSSFSSLSSSVGAGLTESSIIDMARATGAPSTVAIYSLMVFTFSSKYYTQAGQVVGVAIGVISAISFVIASIDICVTKARGRSFPRILRDILGNTLFMVFGGLGMFVMYLVLAMLLAMTIVGQPLAKEILRLAVFVIMPLGRDIRINTARDADAQQQFSFGTRLLFQVLLGYPLALFHYYFAALCILGTVTIPLAPQHIDMARAIASPWNKEVALLWGDSSKDMWEIQKEGTGGAGGGQDEEAAGTGDGGGQEMAAETKPAPAKKGPKKVGAHLPAEDEEQGR